MTDFYAPELKFVRAEAAALDSGQLDRWLQMWNSESLTYWIPSRAGDANPRGALNLVYDDKKRLKQRIDRLNGEFAHTQMPRSVLRRLLGWPDFQAVDSVPWASLPHQAMNYSLVRVPFVIAERRNGEQRIFSGEFEYVLLNENETVSMFAKKVLLDGIEDPVGNISFVW